MMYSTGLSGLKKLRMIDFFCHFSDSLYPGDYNFDYNSNFNLKKKLVIAKLGTWYSASTWITSLTHHLFNTNVKNRT